MRMYGTPGIAWTILHVPTARLLTNVLWIDAEEATYFAVRQPLAFVAGEVVGDVIQARRIDVHHDRLVILIDPIDDDTAAPAREEVSHAGA